LRDQILSDVHRQGQRLQNKVLSIAVDDHAGKTVAFAPHDATQFRFNTPPVTVFGSLHDTAPKEIQIQILPSPRETARNDLRFGIVNGAPDQMIPAVLERNHIAIRGLSEYLEHFARKYPVVSMQNSRTRFDNNSGHS